MGFSQGFDLSGKRRNVCWRVVWRSRMEAS